MANQNQQKPQQQLETVRKKALGRKIRLYFMDGTTIWGNLSFVSKFEYTLKGAYKYVVKDGNKEAKPFKNDVVVLKHSVKYIEILDEK